MIRYPVRVSFDMFTFRYRCLLQGKTQGLDVKKICTNILAILPPEEKDGWQMGVTKVCWRQTATRSRPMYLVFS
jgi:myosin heavy subunit